jgi:hypothetical protein
MHDNPLYSAGDVADILDEPEATIRRWHHSGFATQFGRKADYAVRYSVRDVAGMAVARDLVRLNFPPPLAARIGAIATYRDPKSDATLTGSPAAIALISPEPGSGILQDRCAWRVPAANTATITIPVGAIFADVTTRAARIQHAA